MSPSDECRYDLWYAPEFRIIGIDTGRRDVRDKGLAAFVDTLEAHILEYGVRYPIGVFIRPTGVEIRPGKCRVTALLRLGKEICPAIVADFTRNQNRPDWIRLPHDAQYIQNQFFAGSDSLVEVQSRFFSIKKRDVVRRPGVEDEFSRELRLAGVNGSISGS